MTKGQGHPISGAMRTVVLVALLLLGGCADRALEARRAHLASLIGETEVDLVRQMGVPTRTFTLSGDKFLAYDDRRLEFVPGFYGGPPWFGPGWGPWFWGPAPPIVVQRGCETTFEIENGKVASFSMRGAGC
ncbi:MAG: hypothetical protein ACREFU_20145 [Acetobacteraceae bacterium]